MKAAFGTRSVYEVQVTTLQAIVLLHFNIGDELQIRSFDSLLELTNIGEEYLKRVLHSLSCGKYRILKRVSGNSGIFYVVSFRNEI